ncbi:MULTISPECIES: response regulator transcription factor [unclassified Paenibacillus]|uniref:response regulator transcription factor n=1 Tax=unclassified Paenibacillus TaxID=185978 RepID=UPI0009A58622|nr:MULTISPECIES: response regulator [unclassified Paenibacillus]SLJ88572.1 two-component system, response regulator YesN [Paenibacillus sp. RU5A]SOC62739.1 two-component system, response regulator YesN [Paenibacillus sp. RU26A]SOC68504.1 two-component system, response regulator YesN [Paenibacillus sp. RU5M]
MVRDYTCFIVDDEDLIIQRLELFFNELSHRDKRFVLVGKANNGLNGIEEIIKLKPDIVISDIVMPRMDGISMIEQLKAELPHTQYILLTAYSSFEYAQRAIQANVLEYIVKVPLREADLNRALDKAAGILNEFKKKEAEFQSLNVSVLENKYRVRKQFFNELIRGEIPSHRASDFANRMQFHFFQANYCCFIVEMNTYESFRNEYAAADQNILKYAITNIIEETVMNGGSGVAADLSDNRFIGFLSWENNRSDMETEYACLSLGRQIVSHLHQYLNQRVSVAFGGPHRGWESIKQAYTEAKNVSEDFYYHTEKVVKTPMHRFQYDNDKKADFQQKLADFLIRMKRKISKEELENALADLSQFISDHKIHKSIMAPMIRDLYRDITVKFKSGNKMATEVPDFPMEFMAFQEQLAYIGDFTFEYVHAGQLLHRAEIMSAMHFIEKNLKQRLTLEAIAEEVNLAPSYFSSLFKKTMSEGVISYINRKKIHLALELLNVRDYSLLELCEEVGIVNEGYFCKLFKEYTGDTPKQYRIKMTRYESK